MSKASKARKAKWNRGFTKVPLAQRKAYATRWRFLSAQSTFPGYPGYGQWLQHRLIGKIPLDNLDNAIRVRIAMKKYIEDLEAAAAATRANHFGPRFKTHTTVDVHAEFANKIYGTPIRAEASEALDKLEEQQ